MKNTVIIQQGRLLKEVTLKEFGRLITGAKLISSQGIWETNCGTIILVVNVHDKVIEENMPFLYYYSKEDLIKEFGFKPSYIAHINSVQCRKYKFKGDKTLSKYICFSYIENLNMLAK